MNQGNRNEGVACPGYQKSIWYYSDASDIYSVRSSCSSHFWSEYLVSKLPTVSNNIYTLAEPPPVCRSNQQLKKNGSKVHRPMRMYGLISVMAVLLEKAIRNTGNSVGQGETIKIVQKVVKLQMWPPKKIIWNVVWISPGRSLNENQKLLVWYSFAVFKGGYIPVL